MIGSAVTVTEVKGWLTQWERHVGALDFGAARELFSAHVIGYGTLESEMRGRASLETRQWKEVWPRTRKFAFAPDPVIHCAGNMAVVISLWNSLGISADGKTYPRGGRCTLVLRHEGGKLVCVHSHLSMNPGTVPLEDNGSGRGS